MLARQALYHYNHSTSPVLVIFEIELCFMPRLAWTVILLFVLSHVVGMTGTCHHAQSVVAMGVSLALLVLNHYPLDLHVLSSQDYRFEPPQMANTGVWTQGFHSLSRHSNT
jgi:hypothetical protein